MIYFARRSNGLIKIGTTIHLSVRLKKLNAEHATPRFPLEILGVRKGGVAEEQAIHRRFAAERFDGEWFRPHADLLAFIKEETVEWDGEDEVSFKAKPMAVQIRGSVAWKKWVEEFAEFERDTVAKFVDRLLTQRARDIGFREPPKR